MIKFISNKHINLMSQTKILVICHLQEPILKKYAAQLDYQPDLSRANLAEWHSAMQEIRPTVIIYNTESITREMLQAWRDSIKKERLAIVRAGTSLSKCDLNAAKLYSIQVYNTPGINSKYVADYINHILFKQYASSDRVAIIGTGHIGSGVAIAARDHGADFVLYNKTKKADLLKSTKAAFAHTLEDAIIQAHKIAISLPLDATTQGIITSKIVTKIPRNALLICVSPFKIFTEDALRALYKREDIQVIFDDIRLELQEILRIVGNPNPVRNNFILETKAAASPECQNAMASAAIEKVIALTVPKEDHDTTLCSN